MTDTELLDKLDSLVKEGVVYFMKFDGLREKKHFTLVGPEGRIGDFSSIREAIEAVPINRTNEKTE